MSDFRIRVHIEDDGHENLLERLGFELSSEAADLARELEERRLVVSRDGDDVFVYAATLAEAERARAVVQAELDDLDVPAITGPVEQWLDDEDRWDDDAPDDTWEEDTLERGFAPWEVRVRGESHQAARALAERLEEEGYRVVRRWRYVIVGTGSRDEAVELASRLHGEVEPGGELVWETVPGNPFAVFGGLGSL
jgi:hypothetical protein